MRDFVNKVNHTAFYRYFELINHGKVSIARAITFADEQVERWKLCPLSAFRSAATRMMEQMEHAQAKEAKRKKIPISMTAEGKQDYFDDVIQSRLQEHSQVLVMIRDAYSLSLNLSEKAWKELSKGIADSGQEPLISESAMKYFEDICSTRPERQDRSVTEKTMRELHAATMMVLAEGYEPKRHNLQLLVSQINECHVCWFPDPESQPQMKQEGETSTDSGGGRQEGNGKGRADD